MQLIRHGAIYLASSVIAKATPLLLLPVLTRYLAPEAFAILSIFLGLNALAGALVGMNMHANIASNFYSGGREAVAVVVGNVLCVALATAAIGTLLAGGVALATRDVFSMPSGWLMLMPLLAASSLACSLNATLLRHERRALAFAGFELGQMLVSVSVSLALLVGTDLGWLAMVAGHAAAVGCLALLSVVRMWRAGYLRLRPDRAGVGSVLSLSLPLVPHAMGAIVIAVSDRLFIEHMVGLREVALYSVGYTFGMAMSLVTDATMKAWTPWVYRLLAAGDLVSRQRIVRSGYALAAGFLVAAVLVAALAETLLGWLVAPDYRDASRFVAWITLAYAVRGLYQIAFPMLVHARLTGFLAYNAFVAAGLNLVLNYLLIDRYGAIGGAYATVAAFAASTLLVFWYQQRKFPMPWFGVPR
jgi:O-antigen/teichoic acid export membrane protein